MASETSLQVAVTFVAEEERFHVPDTPLFLSSGSTIAELNELVNHLAHNVEMVRFDFFIRGFSIRDTLQKALQEHSISAEETLCISFKRRSQMPALLATIHYDDWLSSVKFSRSSETILTTSYDGTCQIWNGSADCVKRMKVHTCPIKCGTWLHENIIASGAINGDICISNLKNDLVIKAVGHTDTVTKLAELDSTSAVNSDFLSASLDGSIHFWSVKIDDSAFMAASKEGISRKKQKIDVASIVPVATLTSGGVGVTSITTSQPHKGTFYSAQIDRSINRWDIQAGATTHSVVTNQPATCLSTSTFHSDLVASGHTSAKIHLWDVRDNSLQSQMTLKLPGGSSFVHALAFHPKAGHTLLSGSYDGFVRMWDTRSPTAPLWTLKHGEGKVLGVDWGSKNVLGSVGSDSKMRFFDAQPNDIPAGASTLASSVGK